MGFRLILLLAIAVSAARGAEAAGIEPWQPLRPDRLAFEAATDLPAEVAETEATIDAPRRRTVVMPPSNAAAALRAEPRPVASAAIGILAILTPALLVLLGAATATYVLSRKLDAPAPSVRPRARRRRSHLRRPG